jgi:integrase/recombinase XerD
MVQVVCALRLFYRVTLGNRQLIEHIPYPKREKKLPVVLNKGEVSRLVSSTRDLKRRTVLMTLYATGVRVSELPRFRMEDINSQRMLIRVHQSKARKDRYIPFRTPLWRP